MKKMKKLVVRILSFVIFFNMIGSVSYAASVNKVVISVPSSNYSSTFDAFDNYDQANDKKIVLHVNQDSFPVYATLYGSNGSKEEFKFDTYGKQQLETEDPSGGTVILDLLTFPFLGPLWVPIPHVYATIEIVPPKEKDSKVKDTNVENPNNDDSKKEDSEVEDTNMENPKDDDSKEKYSKVKDINVENSKDDDFEEEDSEIEDFKVISSENSENFDVDLKPLINKIKGLSNYPDESIYESHLKDYLSGKWDGSADCYTDDGVWTWETVSYRTYYWSGYNLYNGKPYNEFEINIDYVGSLDVACTNSYFTFAVNYDTNTIEQWVLLENANSWNLQLDSGEEISSITAKSEIHEDELQGYVFTHDLDENLHAYYLYPNNKVDKIY